MTLLTKYLPRPNGNGHLPEAQPDLRWTVLKAVLEVIPPEWATLPDGRVTAIEVAQKFQNLIDHPEAEPKSERVIIADLPKATAHDYDVWVDTSEPPTKDYVDSLVASEPPVDEEPLSWDIDLPDLQPEPIRPWDAEDKKHDRYGFPIDGPQATRSFLVSALYHAGYRNAKDLQKASDEALLSIRNLGVNRLAYIRKYTDPRRVSE